MNGQTIGDLPETAAESQHFRSQVGHISRHSGVLFAGTIFSAAFGYAFKVYLARALGAEALGIYALGMTIVGFVGIFNSLGFSESAVRFAAVYRATNKAEALRSLLWRAGLILLAANVIFAVIFLGLGSQIARHVYHSPALVHYIPWFAALMLLGVISSFYGRILAGYKAVGRRAIITNFIASPATMLLVILFLSLGLGLSGYLLAQVLASVLVIALLLVMVVQLTPAESRRFFPMPAPLDWEVWSFSAAAVGVLLLEFLLSQVDKIALGFYLGARSVGIYSVAAAMVVYETLILNSVNQVFSPIIADLYARGDMAMLGRLYKALTKWVFGMTLPLAITMIIFARPFMRIFGLDFESGWPILVIGTLGQLVNCGVGSVGYILLMSGNQRRLIKVQSVMAGVMVIASLVFIPIWGIMGAAIAAAITNVGMNLCNLLAVNRAFGFSPYSRGYLRLLPGAIGVFAVGLGVKNYSYLLHHDWVVVLVALLLAYSVFAGLILLMGLDSDDRLVKTAILSRIRGAFVWIGAQS
jgi:O-antigen/teichoic acid export membrane protein